MGGRERLAAALARSKRVGLDSSILIYHLEDLAPYAGLTELVFTLLAKGKFSAILSTISVTELLVKPMASGREDHIEACERFLQGLPYTEIVAPDYEIAREAARLRARYGLRTPDALLLSTSLRRGAEAFLTNDAGVKRAKVEGIAIVLLDDYLPAQSSTPGESAG